MGTFNIKYIIRFFYLFEKLKIKNGLFSQIKQTNSLNVELFRFFKSAVL